MLKRYAGAAAANAALNICDLRRGVENAARTVRLPLGIAIIAWSSWNSLMPEERAAGSRTNTSLTFNDASAACQVLCATLTPSHHEDSNQPASELADAMLQGILIVVAIVAFLVANWVAYCVKSIGNWDIHCGKVRDGFWNVWSQIKAHHELIVYYILVTFVFFQLGMSAGHLLSCIAKNVASSVVKHSPVLDWGSFNRVVATVVSTLPGQIIDVLYLNPIIEKLTWQMDTETLQVWLMEGAGTISIVNQILTLRKNWEKNLTFFKEGFSGRVVISLNLIDNEAAYGQQLSFRTVKDIPLNVLIPDEYIIDEHIDAARDEADEIKGSRQPTAILRLEKVDSINHVRRIRDQITNYISSIYAVGHLSEAASPKEHVKQDFVWALAFEKVERQEARENMNHKYRLLLVRKDHLLELGSDDAVACEMQRSKSLTASSYIIKRMATLHQLKNLVENDSSASGDSDPYSLKMKFLIGYVSIGVRCSLAPPEAYIGSPYQAMFPPVTPLVPRAHPRSEARETQGLAVRESPGLRDQVHSPTANASPPQPRVSKRRTRSEVSSTRKKQR